MESWGGPSIVEYFAEHEGYKCGYCKGKDSNYSHGMWAHALRVIDYEDLINRGWRRSGCYCYKPTMNRTCCPQYTIRCLTTEFQLTRSHKKTLKKINRFLKEGKKSVNEKVQENTASETSQDQSAEHFPAIAEHTCPSKIEICSLDKTSNSSDINRMSRVTTKESSVPVSPEPKESSSPVNPPLKKAKVRRMERKLAKQAQNRQAAKPVLPKKLKNEPKSLEDFLQPPQDAKHKLELRLVQSHPRNPEFEASLSASHSVYRKYQTTIHDDKPDEVTQHKYERFLVNSPLEAVESSQMPHGYGSFHQQYWLDGKLIAVGVVDILPHCLSSVYFYYDPDYSFLSLGNYASLREIAFVRQVQQVNRDFKYYYMGFYIHSCVKMRYKGNYQPSFLLCPETYQWQPLSSCVPRLDECKYLRLIQDAKVKDEDGEVNLKEVLVLHKRQAMRYTSYRSLTRNRDEDEVREYASLVGMHCAKRLLLFRS
nr:EOG090X06AF [Triops cancriformis]